jgi:hypothetical protein
MSGCGRPSRPSVPGGVCSWVETSQTAASSRVFWFGGVVVRGACASWLRPSGRGRGCGASRVARCWVLRGQAPAVSLPSRSRFVAGSGGWGVVGAVVSAGPCLCPVYRFPGAGSSASFVGVGGSGGGGCLARGVAVGVSRGV